MTCITWIYTAKVSIFTDESVQRLDSIKCWYLTKLRFPAVQLSLPLFAVSQNFFHFVFRSLKYKDTRILSYHSKFELQRKKSTFIYLSQAKIQISLRSRTG